MKLNLFNPSRVKPQTMTLKHPITKEDLLDEKGNQITFELASMSSSVARNYFLSKKKKGEDESPENQVIELAIALTLGWSNNVETDDLGKLPFSTENAKKLYEAEDWIAAQVLEFSADSGNFPLGV